MTGNINITRFDLGNNIISGNFNNLTVMNKDNSSDTIQITNGSFDFNLNTVNN